MTRPKKKRRSTRGLTVGVISAASGVIGLAIAVTLGMNSQIDLSLSGLSDGASGSGYRNVTLTDAQLECEQEARKRYGERLQLITVDSHSSRFEKKINRYKMFFNLDIYPKRGDSLELTVPHFLNCYVHGSRGMVTHFESIKDKEYSPKPQRKPTGNIFGF